MQPVENSNIRKLVLNHCQIKCQQKVYASRPIVHCLLSIRLTLLGMLPQTAMGVRAASPLAFLLSQTGMAAVPKALSAVLWARESLPLETQCDRFPKGTQVLGMYIKIPNDASEGEFIWVNHQQWSGFTASDYYKPISQQTSAIWMCCIIWISTLDTFFSYFLFSAKSSWFTRKHKQQVEREKRRINWKSTGRGQGLGNCHSESMFFPSEWHFIGTDPTFTGVSGTICATDLLQHLVRGPRLAILSNGPGARAAAQL